MENLLITSLAVCLLSLAAPAAAQEEAAIKTMPVTERIFMLPGKGANLGLFIADDGTFLIDDQFAPLNPKHLEAIKAADVEDAVASDPLADREERWGGGLFPGRT